MESTPQLKPEEDEEACACALQLVSSSVLPFTLKAAIELRLLDIIVEAGPGAALSPAEIAAQLPTKKPQSAAAAVDRMLRLLAAFSVVTCTVQAGADGRPMRRYVAAPTCRYLTRNDDGVSMASLVLLFQDEVLVDVWRYVKDSVLNGDFPFQAAHGGLTLYEYMGGAKDPRFSKVFNEGMSSHSSIIVTNLLRTYAGFDGVKVLVDVGGNYGAALRMITARHPHIKGINYDLPNVISEAQPLPGVQHVSGDMFETVPSGDAIFLKRLLHDWSDEQCVKILKNCWKALPEKGKVVVVEYVVPVVPEATAKAQALFQLDLAVLAYCVGGKERTEEEFKALAKDAGFYGFNAVHVIADNWVMEFTKYLPSCMIRILICAGGTPPLISKLRTLMCSGWPACPSP